MNRIQWDEVSQWQYYTADGDPWFGFEAVRRNNSFISGKKERSHENSALATGDRDRVNIK
jgi:hypothetical protein